MSRRSSRISSGSSSISSPISWSGSTPRDKIVKRTKKIYTMILFGIINFTYTWYDPKGAIGPQEFADMAVELFLHGFAPGAVGKAATTNRREKV